MPLITSFFRILLVGVIVAPAAAQSPAARQGGCFCLMKPADRYFLVGCRDVSARHATRVTAQCWDVERQDYSEAEIVVEEGWSRVDAGTGSCAPCRPTVRDVTMREFLEVFRGGQSAQSAPQAAGELTVRDVVATLRSGGGPADDSLPPTIRELLEKFREAARATAE